MGEHMRVREREGSEVVQGPSDLIPSHLIRPRMDTRGRRWEGEGSSKHSENHKAPGTTTQDEWKPPRFYF